MSRTRFSGGVWCIFEYASGLAGRDHTVNIIPYLPSARPRWFDITSMNFINRGRLARMLYIPGQLASLAANTVLACFGRRSLSTLQEILRNILHGLNVLEPGILPFESRQGASIRYLRSVVPEADVTLATSYETALPVRVAGSGRRYYFMQHFEPYFCNESPDPVLAGIIASQSYSLGLSMIANSTWLHDRIARETGAADISLCVNAIDHRIFNGQPRVAADTDEIRIISYGGRNAEWKGFREMARAVAIARDRLPGKTIIWRVYGEALLSPDNDIARYDALGFLGPAALAQAYRDCDMLLSASWYESFPLFPLEAMACGLPVITTRFGTEDYAQHGETAHIVEARSPESIADGIRKLVEDPAYRTRLAENGHRASHDFTWERSVQTLETLLTGESPREAAQRPGQAAGSA